MSRVVNQVVMENVVLAVGIKLAVLVLVFAGKATLWMAVASDALALIAVVVNGLKPLCLASWTFREEKLGSRRPPERDANKSIN